MQNIVGILQMAGRGGVVFAEGKNDIGEVYIPQGELKGAPFGMKVLVELTSSPDAEKHTGKIIEVLGDPNLPDVAMESIIHMHGLSVEFPKAVLQQIEDIPSSLTADMIQHELAIGRQDLRSLKTMTIDGLDARDLDDAISIEKLENGNYKLWVHIADVSHYVRESTPLDEEALLRGNSVYLADRVIPMLPPKLSNGICSLNPEQDRLALTVMLEFGPNANLVDGDIFESIISSDLRADYESVFNILSRNEAASEYQSFLSELQWMKELADTLEQQADIRGALEFDFPETKVEMDSEGKVKDIYPYHTTFANDIIEHFMISANRFVAQKFTELALPFLYRVHEYPNPEKLEVFRALLRQQGKKVKLSAEPSPKELSGLLQQLKEMPGSEALQTLLLRSLAKAIYSHKPTGHFGLALIDYAHFTSPIRRYPDLFIHRVIKAFLRDEMKLDEWKAKAPLVAEQCSATERTAIEAERDSVDQKVAEYYADRLGEIYEAKITGFVGAGMFVMLPSSAEAMIPFRTMNDYYAYDEITMTALGRGNHRLFKIGDTFEVQIARVDKIKRQVDVSLVDENTSGRIDLEFRQASGGDQFRANRSKKKKNTNNKNYSKSFKEKDSRKFKEKSGKKKKKR